MATRRRASIAALLLIVFSVIALALSPLLLIWFSQLPVDWQTLSLIGQSYGGAATLLSGAALIGIVVTARQQARQTRIAAEQAVRQLHFEILREARDDPRLMRALEPVPEDQVEPMRQGFYLNSYFMFLRMGWLSGQITLAEIEDLASYSFSTPPGARWWSQQDHLRRNFEPAFVGALTRGADRAEVQDEQTSVVNPAAQAEAPGTTSPAPHDVAPPPGRPLARQVTTLLAIGASALLGWRARVHYERTKGAKP